MRGLSHESGFDRKIWQFPVVLVPLGTADAPDSVVLRPVDSVDGMTAQSVSIDEALLCRMAGELMAVAGRGGRVFGFDAQAAGDDRMGVSGRCGGRVGLGAMRGYFAASRNLKVAATQGTNSVRASGTTSMRAGRRPAYSPSTWTCTRESEGARRATSRARRVVTPGIRAFCFRATTPIK